ncbi:MAG: agmatinase [Candidatus Omnitrophota bacterium]|jgi:agmatinase
MEEKNNMSQEGLQSPAETFGIEDELPGFKKSKVVILKVPYERTTTYIQGTKNGPQAIIDASKYMEVFDEELNQETYKIGIHVMDIPGVGELTSEAMVDKVSSSTADLLKSGKFPIVLGGEHSVSVGVVKAFKETYPNLSVLHLDAHYDMRDEFKGSKLNHGCVARRISEICPIVQIGTRSLCKEEKDFVASQPPEKVKVINVYDILEMPLWKDAVSNSLTENVYISIDLDVFDPSLVPAVGTPEPGGIGWYEMLDLLKEIAKDKKIVGFDVVELCPIKGQISSDFLAAKLIYRLLGYIFSKK